MNYELIKAAVAAVIKENGNEEITGNILQQSLLAIIDVLGLGYQYAGIATPTTAPGTPDAKVFYIAQAAGTYSNFNDGTSSPVLDGTAIGLFAFDTQWHNTILDVATKSSLGAYLKIADLATETGNSEQTAMTQKAVSDIVASIVEDLDGKIDKVANAVAGNLPEFGNDGTLLDSGIPSSDVATKQELAVAELPGVAEAVVDTDGAGTEQQFTFRKSGGDGGAYYRKMKGKTLAWNQIFPGWRGGGKGISINTSATLDQVNNYGVVGHKYYFSMFYRGTGFSGSVNIRNLQRFGDYIALNVTENKARYSEVYTCLQRNTINIFATINAGTLDIDDTFQIDLTQEFGAGNEPTTVAEFEALYPNTYYPNNPGTLISNDADAVETTGVNLWDEQWEIGYINDANGQNLNDAGYERTIRAKNLRPCLPNTEYYGLQPAAKTSQRLYWYDVDGGYIKSDYCKNTTVTSPSNACYFKWALYAYGTTYNYDICINISNAAINGQYFPYWKRDLQLNITTRKDTDGNVPFPNGLQSCPVAQDEATKEGGIIRVGTRAYQAGDESDANVITDGTNTNYALATPVPFTWEEPLNLGVKVDENGTEKAVAPEGATEPSAPFVADTTYTMSIQRMVQKLATL